MDGDERVARTLIAIATGAPTPALLERRVNGQPGLTAPQDGAMVVVMALALTNDRIKHVWAIRNPEKPQPWTARGYRPAVDVVKGR